MDERRSLAGQSDSTTDVEPIWRESPAGLEDEPSSAAPEATEEPAPTEEPSPPEPSEPDPSSGGIVSHLQGVADVASAVGGAIGTVIEAAGQAWSIREAMTSRRLSRQAREPLANLYELYPEAREASPHELGLRFVPVDEIRGTAVAGATQRGGDFLPLKPFRGENWWARWRRIREANERLQPLPPVDLIKFDGDYWVVDGHNRVAAMLYANGVGVDAMVIEMVPLDGMASERPTNLLSLYNETEDRRTAAAGVRPVEPAEPPDPAEPNPSGPEDPAR